MKPVAVKKKQIREKKEELNKWRDEGKTHPGARNREGCRTYDPDEITADLLQWADLPDSISFSQFCASRNYNFPMIWRLDQSHAAFHEAYDIVKLKLASRREDMLNNNLMNYGTFNRYQKMYDPFLSHHEDEEKDKDAARARGIAQQEQANLILLAQMAAEGKIRQED